MRLRLRVHPAGLALLLGALFFAQSDAALSAVLALFWHEGAHLLSMRLLGVPACAVELTPFGGMADVECFERLPGAKQWLIAVSGIAASLLAGIACMRLAPPAPFWRALTNANLALGLLNALPVWPLDGARALLAVAAFFGLEAGARRAMTGLAYALGGAMVALGLYGAWRGHVNLSLFALGPYLCYAAREGAVAYGVRCMRRAEVAGAKLSGGEALPARVFACAREPSPGQLARLMARMSPQRYHFLLVVDEKTGCVKHTVSEREMADALFCKHFSQKE